MVKALNSMSVDVMIDPKSVPGPHEVFICGNDPDAKAQVTIVLVEWFGWEKVIDLGDITSARGMEMALPLWLSLRAKYGTNLFNLHIAK